MFKFIHNVPLNGYTIVIPSLSVGNVPQLAVDLVIETLQMRKIALAWHSGIVPMLGPPAFSGVTEPTSSCELFVNEERKVAVIQLRAPIAAKQLQSFVDQLIELIEDLSPARVVILASCFSHERHDMAMQRKLEYMANERFKVMHCEKLSHLVEHTGEKLPGQGFAEYLYRTMDSKLMLAIGTLFSYVSEGDNVPDAKDLAQYLNYVTAIFPESTPLLIPMSWKFLFGNSVPAQLF